MPKIADINAQKDNSDDIKLLTREVSSVVTRLATYTERVNGLINRMDAFAERVDEEARENKAAIKSILEMKGEITAQIQPLLVQKDISKFVVDKASLLFISILSSLIGVAGALLVLALKR